MKRREGRVVRQRRGRDRRRRSSRPCGTRAGWTTCGRRRRRPARAEPGDARAVIPLEYRLREAVRLEAAGGRQLAGGLRGAAQRADASTRPPRDCSSGPAAARRSPSSPPALALAEERILTLCEYFRGRGILEVAPAPAADRRLRAVGHGDRSHPRPGGGPRRLPRRARAAWTTRRPARGHRRRRRLGRPGARWRGRGRGARRAGCWSTSATAARPSRATGRPREATGEILAFVDSDCVADARLAPGAHALLRLGAGGGGGRPHARLLHRVAARPLRGGLLPLDMGAHLLLRGGRGRTPSTCPPATCWCGAPSTAELGGLREDLRVGEDVDLCWRLRARGRVPVYAPEGIVRHKHRDRLGAMLRRRADYGTSEATLHALHPDKRKRLPLPPAPRRRWPWSRRRRRAQAVAARRSRSRLRLWDAARRTRRLRRSGVDVPAPRRSVLGAPRPPLDALLRLLPPGALLPRAAGRRRRRRARRAGCWRRSPSLYAGGRRLRDAPASPRASRRTSATTWPSTRRIRPG